MSPKQQNLPDIRQTVNYANYLKTQGWVVSSQGGPASGGEKINYFIKKFPLLGSVLKIQRPKEIRYKDIKILSEKYRVFQFIVEPLNLNDELLIKNYGFKLSNSPFLPSKTIHLDLTQSNRDIFRNFSKDCKYSIKKSSDAFGFGGTGGSIGYIKSLSSSQEIKKFHNAWKNSVNFKRYVPSFESLLSLKKSFPNNHSIFLASHNKSGSIIGGAIFTISSHDVSNYIIYYWQGFTNQEGRTSLSQYSLLYHGILWGKRMGCKIFDFEGIYDDRFPNKSWLGFTHFKKSFGGTEVLYPGCYTKFRLPLW